MNNHPQKYLLALGSFILGQFHGQVKDSVQQQQFTVHTQTTIINQYKPGFAAAYSGDNSLKTAEESQTSLTSTLFLGAQLWEGASIYLNPEIAGGSGLSEALGIASATNGETFRIGNPAPKLYVARAFFKQYFPLSSERMAQSTDANQLAGQVPSHYLSLILGKIGVADYFDNNQFSHNPRTQFMSWGLMSNGAWDYPANTRGYSPSMVLEYVSPKHEFRYGLSLLPLEANGPDMNWDLGKASAHTIEYTHKHQWGQQPGAFRLLAFVNTGNMANYETVLAQNPQNPSAKDYRYYGRSKYGFALNAEQNISPDLGLFFRASWNDGRNETWAFTEIDHGLSLGAVLSGNQWQRPNDKLGLAHVASGISKPHQNYLKAGGKGFMLGDGQLNYAWEHLTEAYYSADIYQNKIFFTGAYQFVLNPGYNADRQGLVNVFSLRLHAKI
jgi:high affinity Mn2+ porin